MLIVDENSEKMRMVMSRNSNLLRMQRKKLMKKMKDCNCCAFVIYHLVIESARQGHLISSTVKKKKKPLSKKKSLYERRGGVWVAGLANFATLQGLIYRVELWGVDSDRTVGGLRCGQQKRMGKGAVRYQGFWATAKVAMCEVQAF
uniref:Uncharacterized protein n=1 Tax=Salix viminalis TaxID=40686 RepID=A0A6N2L1K1_SALVM